MNPDPDLERRVLVMAPTRKDTETTLRLLASAGIPADTCATPDALLSECERGAAVLLIPEEVVGDSRLRRGLASLVQAQPDWSDLPILVLARSGARSPAATEAARTLGNVTVLERPVQVVTLVSAIRTAQRARERQLQIRSFMLERARTEDVLRLADQRKDEFLAMLGHELRNPLAPLLAALSLLKVSGRAADLQRLVPMMERQVQHLVRLVGDLLEMSRISRGLIDIRHEPTDLTRAIEAAIESSRPVIEAPAHTLHVDVPHEPVLVIGDSVRLTQVFVNLLNNAAKYTNPGGHIWLTLRRDGSRARVVVRDDGIGIPPEQLDAVFDMFKQVDRADRRGQGGLGIGLTLVRRVVALHGGEVVAHSAGAGRGSEFTVELPEAADASPLAGTDGECHATALPHKRVLVVDDNRDAADALGGLLQALGLTVAVRYSGVDALALFVAFAPDVMLLDIGMPDMDGYVLARHVRALEEGAHVVLIAVTGWGQEHDVTRAREAGFDHHLVKPPDVDRLRELVLSAPPTRIERPQPGA